ncbi:MAG: type I-F CRISPR-associated endoribonuclease Cas6/Csy4 [Proteobacteria bacterium ST_bin11]|nr:MAG: type I-F CRISPR-associated endoribonuclease Cas6/Csy4 [Proteobacteria bacterium ST_bin11]
MNHYIEITLLPNPDINLFGLWSKVYQQLHLGLVEMQDAQQQVPIGVSFPEYTVGEKFSLLGGKCRLFAQDEAVLARFDAPKWLARLSDYVHCTSIRPIPDKLTGYAIYRRERPKTNPERLARRYAKRHGLDLETALNITVELKTPVGDAAYPTKFRYADMTVPSVALPFIRLQSLSGGQTFCLWIAKTEVGAPVAGSFSAYGLSSAATVPEF